MTAAATLAVGLHVALLIPFVAPGLSGASRPVRVEPMQVRLLDAAPTAPTLDPESSSESGVSSVQRPPASDAEAVVPAVEAARPIVASKSAAAVPTGPGERSSSTRATLNRDRPFVDEPDPTPRSAPVPSGLPPAPAYVVAGKLDPGPRPLDDIDPAYPPEAGQQEGTVVLRLLVSESGDVDDVVVVRSFPSGFFEASALAAFGAAKFAPGLLLGVPVKSQMTVEVRFTPLNRGAQVSGRGY